MRNNKIPRSANAKYHYSYLFFYKINKGDLPSFSRHCDMATGHGVLAPSSNFPRQRVVQSTKKTRNKRVLPVKIINPKNDHSHVKTK